MVLRVLVAIALLCGVVHADGKPWADGVSDADQKKAMGVFDVANDLYEKGNYVEALAKYDAALATWNHPAIHYNKAMCLMSLERTLDAFSEMEQAMAQGEAPLGKDLFKEGTRYLKLLGDQVATFGIDLKTPGATVKLDGKTEIKPGMTQRVLAKDEHTLIGEKPGFKTKTIPVTLRGGQTTTIEVKLDPEEKGRTERRWARWKPWAVVAAGGVVAIVGVPLLLSAKSEFELYDSEFAGNDGCPMGCRVELVPSDVAAHKTTAETRQKLAFGAFAVGGATMVAGIVLVVLNQPRLVGAKVTPNVGTEHAGATLSFDW